jgi:hypothetical protein
MMLWRHKYKGNFFAILNSLGLGYQMASTASTSVVGNMLAGRRWDSNINIGVGSFTLPFRNGKFSLNPVDHIDNILTVWQHTKAIHAAIKGNAKINLDLNSMRMTATRKGFSVKGYVGGMFGQNPSLWGRHRNGVIYLNSEEAYSKRFSMGYEGEALSDIVSEEVYHTKLHEGVHALQSGFMGGHLLWKNSYKLASGAYTDYDFHIWEVLANKYPYKIMTHKIQKYLQSR